MGFVAQSGNPTIEILTLPANKYHVFLAQLENKWVAIILKEQILYDFYNEKILWQVNERKTTSRKRMLCPACSNEHIVETCAVKENGEQYSEPPNKLAFDLFLQAFSGIASDYQYVQPQKPEDIMDRRLGAAGLYVFEGIECLKYKKRFYVNSSKLEQNLGVVPPAAKKQGYFVISYQPFKIWLTKTGSPPKNIPDFLTKTNLLNRFKSHFGIDRNIVLNQVTKQIQEVVKLRGLPEPEIELFYVTHWHLAV